MSSSRASARSAQAVSNQRVEYIKSTTFLGLKVIKTFWNKRIDINIQDYGILGRKYKCVLKKKETNKKGIICAAFPSEKCQIRDLYVQHMNDT